MKMTGVVQKSKGRGKALGFPTANLAVDTDTEDGIYVGWVMIAGVKRAGLIFIGAAVTFGETERQAEVYLLDFEGDLYGKAITVDLLRKIRDNQKFNTPQELVAQMKQDEQVARRYFKDEDYPRML